MSVNHESTDDHDVTVYQVLVADRLSSDRSVAKPDRESAEGKDEGDGKEDEGFDEEKEKPLEESQHLTGDAYPATFVDLCVQMTERARFLLEVRTGTLLEKKTA